MKHLILLFLTMIGLCALGQVNTDSELVQDYINSSIQNMSPQTAAMVMYDNLPLAQNTGRLDLSIPLIHFEDPDFEFPISVKYNSEGLKPNTLDNYVGRDWSLVCGGLIYREIKGKPDDLKRVFYEDIPVGEFALGFLHTCRSGKYNQDDIVNKVLTNSPSNLIGTLLLDENTLAFKSDYLDEFSSDIYHFNFGKHSGKFIINFDGSVTASGSDGGKYLVDITRYKLVDYTTHYDSEIRITTDDGYIYCFGGSYEAVEYNALSWENVHRPTRKNNQIVGFYLSKIIAPNGRTLTISYLGENIDAIYHEEPVRLLNKVSFPDLIENNYNLNYSLQVRPFSYSYLSRKLAGNTIFIAEFPARRKTGISYSLNKIALIDKIATDDKEIIFKYTARKKPTLNIGLEFLDNCGGQLDRVELRSVKSASVIEYSQLLYSYTDQPNSRMFLSSLKNSEEGTYRFNYDALRLPPPITSNIDYWGYWRGSESTRQGLLPNINEGIELDGNSTNDFEYIDDLREPNGSECSLSLLKRITYPTGGVAKIKYEPNDYSSYIEQNTSTQFYKRVRESNVNYTGGGARVSEIQYLSGIHKSLDPQQIVKKTTYKYTQKPDSYLSSGILMGKPQYYHISRTTNNPNQSSIYSYLLLYNSSGFANLEYAGLPIQYSVVTQYNTENSEVIGNFSNVQIGISPPSSDGTESSLVYVGRLGESMPNGDEIERANSRWKITIHPDNTGDAQGYIKIRNNTTKEIVYEKTITSNRGNFDEIFNPYSKFGKGTYSVEIGKTGLTYVKFVSFCTGAYYLNVTGSAIVTKYTDYLTNPDLFTDEHSFWAKAYLNRKSAIPRPDLDELYLKRNFLEPEDHSIERGKILSQTFLSLEGDTIQMIKYKYARQGFERFGIYAAISPSTSNAITPTLFAHINKVHFYTYKPIEKVTRNYFPDLNQYYDLRESYEYDADGYLRNSTTYFASDKQKHTKYTYCYDDSVLPGINISGLLTGKTEFERTASGEKRILHTQFKYNQYGKIASMLQYSGNENIVSNIYSGFDSYGNPTYTQTKQGNRFTYIWGYKGKYPIAKIENANPADIRHAIGISPENLSTDGDTKMDLINSLRYKLPDAHIYTYTYKPLVGMATVTDPAGQTVEFFYDSANRLKYKILHTEFNTKQILQANTYNLTNF